MEFSSGGVIIHKDKVALVESMKVPPHKAITFPKGHMNKGEDNLEAAYREIKEETGLESSDLALVKSLGSYVRPDGTSKKPKRIYMFLFAAINKRLKPLDKDNPSAKWVPKRDVYKTLTFKEDKEFWRKVLKEEM